MYSRIDLPLTTSAVAGLLAAGPWLLSLAATLTLAMAVHPLALATAPLLLMGALDRWRRCGSLRHTQAVIKLTVTHTTLRATLVDGRELEVAVARGSRTSGGLLVLGLRGVRLRREFPAVLIPAPAYGNTDATALRRLRVWLRLMPDAAAPTQSAAWH